jgi:hypothetical protein
MADKKTYKTASGAQQYGSSEDFKKQGMTLFPFSRRSSRKYDDPLISSAMTRVNMERWQRKQRLLL